MSESINEIREDIELDCELTTDEADGDYPLFLAITDEDTDEDKWFIAGYPDINTGLNKALEYEALEYSGDEHNQEIYGIRIRDGHIDKDSLMDCVKDLLEQCGWFNENEKAYVYDLYWWGRTSLKIRGKHIFKCFTVDVE